MKKIIDSVSQFFVKLMHKLLPDPFIFAVLLSFVVFIAAFFTVDKNPENLVTAWYGGFWSLLGFAMQMCLILVTGTVMATSKPFKALLSKAATLPKNKLQAVFMVSFVSLIACFINWGFGLIIGSIFAREIAKKIRDVDYPLLIASAYGGFIVWHAGFSGSIPLQLAGSAEALTNVTKGALTQSIPISDTILSPFNLTIVGLIILIIPILLVLMHPKKENTVTVKLDVLNDDTDGEDMPKVLNTPADKLENSFVITLLLCIMGFTYIVSYFMNKGLDLNLNIVIFIFMFTGFILHKTPINIVKAYTNAAKSVGGIILQFPFYAGIMGLMTYAPEGSTSIATNISNYFVSIANENTFPVLTFLSAGIVNFFVPSGGGQWVVQAPIAMTAGSTLGVEPSLTGMSIAWGDAWTNMIQPFWALPALGIAKLGAKDIMGYCVMILIVTGIIISGTLFIFS